jgi:hypothetical protein
MLIIILTLFINWKNARLHFFIYVCILFQTIYSSADTIHVNIIYACNCVVLCLFYSHSETHEIFCFLLLLKYTESLVASCFPKKHEIFGCRCYRSTRNLRFLFIPNYTVLKIFSSQFL